MAEIIAADRPDRFVSQLIGRGVIARRGLLSPVTGVPYDAVISELAKRGIRIIVDC